MYGTQTPGEVADARKDEGTVHGPADADRDQADPVNAARQSAAASSSVTKDRDPSHGME